LIFYGLAGTCLLLGAGLVLTAWRRPRRQRGARTLAGALAAAALWLTAYPPQRALPAARAEAIVLTEGYQPDTLRQLLRRLGAGTPVWRYGPDGPAGARPLGSLLALAEQRPALRRIHVLGQGLPAGELPQLGAVALRPHTPPAFQGFRSAAWPRQTTLGEALSVAGTVAALPTGGPAWVGLRAAGALRDSVRVPANGGPFWLRYRPKATGLALYTLVLRQPGQPPRTEPVPVEIVAPVRPPVLLLSAAPSFEFKFLKNHLAGQPRAVAVRTAVSRGLVQTEFLNQPVQALDHLTPALLARYAVVVADAATLAGLSAPENLALRGAIQAGRLGLVVLADAAPLPAATPARADFLVLPRATAGASPQPLNWPDAPAAVLAAQPATLRPTAALQPLVQGPGAALVAARRRYGLGAVVVSVVPETFRWALQNQPAAYASFWSRLLTAATPPVPAATWRIAGAWPRAQTPSVLQLATSTFPESSPTVRPLAGGAVVQLPLRQDTRLPEWSTAAFWPAAAGWHRVQGPGRVSFSFYVFGVDDWPGPDIQQRQLAAAQRATATAPPATAADEVRQPWPAGWFFGLFLLAAGYLWLEEKL